LVQSVLCRRCGLVERDVADLVDPAPFDHYLLAQSATAACETDEPHLGAQVVVARLARRALVTDEIRFDHNIVAEGNVGDALADRLDGARELVPHRDRWFLMGERMWTARGRDEDGSLEVLVQVGAADPTPSDLEFHCAGPQLWLWDVFDPDVLLTVEPRCFHRSAPLFGDTGASGLSGFIESLVQAGDWSSGTC
jgi:hypothetical protein